MCIRPFPHVHTRFYGHNCIDPALLRNSIQCAPVDRRKIDSLDSTVERVDLICMMSSLSRITALPTFAPIRPLSHSGRPRIVTKTTATSKACRQISTVVKFCVQYLSCTAACNFVCIYVYYGQCSAMNYADSLPIFWAIPPKKTRAQATSHSQVAATPNSHMVNTCVNACC